jgi:hypothetical protein
MNFAFANVAASSTDAPLTNPITGQALTARDGQKIRVYAAFVVGDDTATDVTFYSNPDTGTSTAISPILAFGSASGISLPHNPVGWFETLPGETLGITTSAGSTQGVHVVYDYLPGNAH